jgi:Cdc6-like AAA superfamily ATPase
LLIPLSREHWTVVGKTRSGKTYAVKKSLEAVKSGVLFFNTQLEDMPASFVRADGDNSMMQIKKALRAGKKVDFQPDVNKDIRAKQLIHIVNELYDGSTHDMYLVADECHLYKKEALDALTQIATTGLKWGIAGIFLSQRFQKIDNTLVTQSSRFVMFETNLEPDSYFREYGIPIDDIQARIGKMDFVPCPDGVLRPLAYCLFDGRVVEGAYRV